MSNKTTTAKTDAAKRTKRSTLYWVRIIIDMFDGEGFQGLAIRYADNEETYLACVGLYCVLLTIAGKCGMDGLIGFASGKPMVLANIAYTTHLNQSIVEARLADLIGAGMIHQDNNGAYYIAHWEEDGQPSSAQYNARTDDEKRESHNASSKKYREKRKTTLEAAEAAVQGETPEEKAERSKTFDIFWRRYPNTIQSNRAEARKLWSLRCSRGINPDTINYATEELCKIQGSCLAPADSSKKIPKAEDYLYRELYNQINGY